MTDLYLELLRARKSAPPSPYWLVAFLFWASLFSGCATDQGALSQAGFAPDCPATDESCAAFGLTAPIATGTRLPLRIDTNTPGATSPLLSLESVDPSVLDTDGRVLIAVSAGMSAILVTTDSLVFDFIHVYVEDPTDLRLIRHTRDGVETGEVGPAIQMLVGEELVLSSRPTVNGDPLLGNGRLSWTQGETPLLTPVDDGFVGLTRFVAREPGEVELTADQIGLTASLTVEVLP